MNSDYDYQDGNRMPVPAALTSKHFFYKAVAPKVDASDVDTLATAVRAHVERGGLNPAEIDLLTAKLLESMENPAVLQAFLRLSAALVESGAKAHRNPTVLFCEWASAHVDDSYEGTAFASLVLHTGPNPYLMQTFHTQPPTEQFPQLSLKSETRVLKVGDLMVFDPCTPHLVVPVRPHQDQLLVLLQLEVADKSPEDRLALLQSLPPVEGDRDCVSIFEGYSD